MDLVLNNLDHHIFTPYVYPATWKEDDPWRQIVSLLLIASIGGYVVYFVLATFSYSFIFDKRLLTHPQILENQVRREIMCTVISMPFMSILTVTLIFLEVRGYSKLYDNVSDTRLGYAGCFISIFTFLAFTDMCVYWIHRFLHHKLLYKHLHKLHHKWKIPTPFASHALHPVDAFLQGLPYQVYPFLFPLHKVTYLVFTMCINIWTVSIHDGNYRVPQLLKPFVNGSAHHTDHHVYYNYNYGQFFTLWDRIGGSFRNPSSFEGYGPMDQILAKEKELNRKNGVVNGTANGVANGTKNGHTKKQD